MERQRAVGSAAITSSSTCAAREGGGAERAAGGEVVVEALPVEVVELRPVGHVGEEDGGFDDVAERAAVAGEDRLDLVEDLVRLGFDAAGDDVERAGRDGDLAAEEEEAGR